MRQRERERERERFQSGLPRQKWMLTVFGVCSLHSMGYMLLRTSTITSIGLNSIHGDINAPNQGIRELRKGDQICKSAVNLFGPNSLESKIEDAKDFHQRGGNLISIENYLNREIESTLSRMDMKFDFNKENDKSTGKAVDDLALYYKTHDVPRGGYGQPLPGKWSGKNTGKVSPLFEERWINVVEPDTAARFKVAIGSVGPKCSKQIHFAEGSYEEKIFCVPPDSSNEDNSDQNHLRSTSTVNIEKEYRNQDQSEECHIVSIGSNDQWGFEEEVIKKLPHCVTHTFDCTLRNNQPLKKPKSDDVRFYPYCIGDGGSGDSGDENKKFLPYHELWKQTNTTQPPKLLKIDVEGFEFGVIPHMLRSSPPETWPEQIMMEVHWATRMVDVPSMLRTRQASEISLMFGQLFNFGGYLPVLAKYFEPGCSTCLEVLLVRVLCSDSF